MRSAIGYPRRSAKFDAAKFDAVRFDAVRFDAVRFDAVRFDAGIGIESNAPESPDAR